MSVTNTQNSQSGTGNSSTVAFSFPFKIFDPTQVLVYQTNISTKAVTGPMVLNTDYTIAINTTTEGGVITFTVAPATGYTWTIIRNVPYTQTVAIPTEGALPGIQISNQLDLMTMMIIQANSNINSGLQMPITYSGTLPVLFPLPAANQVIGWDPTGTFLINQTVGGVGPTGPAGPTGPQGAAGTGSVNSVTSANSDISVANTTTTPVLTLNSGTSAGQIVKLDGSARLPAVDGSQLTNLPVSPGLFVPNNIQIFVASGTWTKPTGVSKVYVKVIGAGGAGGTGSSTPGGGGGGGGYAEGFIAVTGNVTVTIGSTNSFAGSTTIQATAGGAASAATPGAGGVGSGGVINATGQPGTTGTSTTLGGTGGSSLMGPGGTAQVTSTNGIAGCNFGGGGGGGNGNSHTGGAGDPGAVIVYY